MKHSSSSYAPLSPSLFDLPFLFILFDRAGAVPAAISPFVVKRIDVFGTAVREQLIVYRPARASRRTMLLLPQRQECGHTYSAMLSGAGAGPTLPRISVRRGAIRRLGVQHDAFTKCQVTTADERQKDVRLRQAPRSRNAAQNALDRRACPERSEVSRLPSALGWSTSFHGMVFSLLCR